MNFGSASVVLNFTWFSGNSVLKLFLHVLIFFIQELKTFLLSTSEIWASDRCQFILNPFCANVQYICHCGNFSTGPWHVYLSLRKFLERPMSSIFGIAKTSPGAGFKKIFKIFLSPKYDNYIWHVAYEMEKEFNFRFQMTNIFGTRLMNLKKRFNFRFQMTNIFGMGHPFLLLILVILSTLSYNETPNNKIHSIYVNFSVLQKQKNRKLHLKPSGDLGFHLWIHKRNDVLTRNYSGNEGQIQSGQ